MRISNRSMYRFRPLLFLIFPLTVMVLLNGNQVVFADHILGFIQLNKILERKLHPDSRDRVQLSSEDLRSRLLANLNQKELSLMDIHTKDNRPLESVISADTDEIHIIHATCGGVN